MNTRTTKVYSITMPPALGKQAERLAKQEHRTMSELMREALRRYQDAITKPSALSEALALIRADAKEKGLDKLTKREIDAVMTKTRSEMRAGNKRNSSR